MRRCRCFLWLFTNTEARHDMVSLFSWKVSLSLGTSQMQECLFWQTGSNGQRLSQIYGRPFTVTCSVTFHPVAHHHHPPCCLHHHIVTRSNFSASSLAFGFVKSAWSFISRAFTSLPSCSRNSAPQLRPLEVCVWARRWVCDRFVLVIAGVKPHCQSAVKQECRFA